MKKYETMEHTADVKLRIRGTDLEELFENGACAVYDLIADAAALAEEKPELRKKFSLKAENPGALFLLWLREILFSFSVRHFVGVKYHFIHLDDTHLEAEVFGRKFDPKRHDQKHEVKAVTYHDFKFEQTKDGWLAEVIFDV